MYGLELANGEILQVPPEHRFYSNGEWVEAGELQPRDILQNKDGDHVTILGIETLPRYQKVYNFDVEGNENYYVTEEGILVHNGYGSKDGAKLEQDIADALDEAGISYKPGEKFGPNGSIGEIDFLLEDVIVEATVKGSGKLGQVNKLLTNEIMNPNGLPVILVGPNYTNSAAVKAIEDAGATVVHSIEDLIGIVK